MTIDEAIKICEEDAEKIGGNPQSDRHAERCRQLAEWLMELKDLRAAENEQEIFIHELMGELKEAKRLLKAAVKDLRYLESHTVDEEGSCLISDRGERIRCFECPFNNGGKVNEKCVWNYEAEALKLIGGETDEKP